MGKDKKRGNQGTLPDSCRNYRINPGCHKASGIFLLELTVRFPLCAGAVVAQPLLDAHNHIDQLHYVGSIDFQVTIQVAGNT